MGAGRKEGRNGEKRRKENAKGAERSRRTGQTERCRSKLRGKDDGEGDGERGRVEEE